MQGGSVAQMFATVEGAVAELGVREWSLSQTTLEQVYLRLAREQEEAEHGQHHQ